MSLNDIVNEYKGKSYTTNYKDLLKERADNRLEDHKNWKKIENIKDLKQGYLSQVVHIISKMMVEYDAVVVLEDLNGGFVRDRQKRESNVYKQFEKSLSDKLGYYVDKQKNVDEPGGVLHALQLTSNSESSKRNVKQNGCLFYIPAWNTSKTDPITGFVNLFKFKDITNAQERKDFFLSFDSIRFVSKENGFEFIFNYDNFETQAEDSKKIWSVYTHGKRIVKDEKNGHKQMKNVYPTDILIDAFEKIGVNLQPEMDVMPIIDALEANNTNASFFSSLFYAFKITLQMRNSNTQEDFILSPVKVNGQYFDSTNEANKGHDSNGNWISKLPVDADANGAYNIARKGLWAIRQIQETPAGERPNLAIKNKEWLNFAQQKPYEDE